MSGKLSFEGIFPVILGHEAVSVVDKLGPEAAVSYGFREGDLVGATLWHNMCMTCVNCKDVGTEYCSRNKMVGVTRPGYFAEFTLVDAANAVVIARGDSDGGDTGNIPSPTVLSPLFCAGVTVWDALEQAHLHPGETVAVIGAGGLGELAIRYAQALGGYTLALDVRNEQLQACKGNGGANENINTGALSPEAVREEIRRVNKGRAVDVAIVTASAVAAYQTAFDILRPEGRLVVVGMPAESFPLSLTRFGAMGFQYVLLLVLISFYCLLTALSNRMIGAKAPGRISTEKCLDFSLRKNILPRVNPRIFRLEEINEMVALMEDGQVQDGRMVIEFP